MSKKINNLKRKTKTLKNILTFATRTCIFFSFYFLLLPFIVSYCHYFFSSFLLFLFTDRISSPTDFSGVPKRRLATAKFRPKQCMNLPAIAPPLCNIYNSHDTWNCLIELDNNIHYNHISPSFPLREMKKEKEMFTRKYGAIGTNYLHVDCSVIHTIDLNPRDVER